MFGLAYWPNYHYYRGHVMWDIETFAVPTLILTDPNAARTLLGYRVSGSRAPGKNASLHGYQGAQFPWESSGGSRRKGAPRGRGGGVRASRKPGCGVRIQS